MPDKEFAAFLPSEIFPADSPLFFSQENNPALLSESPWISFSVDYNSDHSFIQPEPSVKNSNFLSDIQSNKIYETNEAISSGIMDDKYYVTISKGDKLLYSGKMSQLMKQEYITLDEPIFLEVDTKIKFSMEIYFDALAGNEYQNKKYEYVVYPKVFKIKEEFKPEINLPQTGSIISSNLIIVLSILLIVFGTNIKVAKGRNINEK